MKRVLVVIVSCLSLSIFLVVYITISTASSSNPYLNPGVQAEAQADVNASQIANGSASVGAESFVQNGGYGILIQVDGNGPSATNSFVAGVAVFIGYATSGTNVSVSCGVAGYVHGIYAVSATDNASDSY